MYQEFRSSFFQKNQNQIVFLFDSKYMYEISYSTRATDGNLEPLWDGNLKNISKSSSK